VAVSAFLLYFVVMQNKDKLKEALKQYKKENYYVRSWLVIGAVYHLFIALLKELTHNKPLL